MVRSVLVSWTVPPVTTGSSVIVGNLARQFHPEEMVIVGAKPWAAPALEWQQRWPPINYASIEPPPALRGGRWLRIGEGPIVLLRILQVCRKSRAEVVLAVFPDEVYLTAALLASKLLRLTFVPYFHNTLVENRVDSRIARWLQRAVFASSPFLLVISEGMQCLYADRYPDIETHVVPHTFPEALGQDASCPPVHMPLRLAFSGNVNGACDVAMANLVAAIQGMDNVDCSLYTGSTVAALRRVGVSGPKFSTKELSRRQLLESLRDADVLLLPHGFGAGRSGVEMETIFPTKTIEYLISGRPILAHVQPGTFLSEFLTSHQCAYVVHDPDADALRKALEDLRSDGELRHRLVINALRTAMAFQGDRVAQELRLLLAQAMIPKEQ